MIKINFCTKAILTVIAVSLVVLVFQGTGFADKAQANVAGQDVNIANLATDITPGETLHVYCTNC